MSKYRLILIYVSLVSLLVIFHGRVRAQTFHKGTILVSISEGTTHTRFTTTHPPVITTHAAVTTDGNTVTRIIDGDRDPLTIEYGISNRVGLGLNMGGDLIKVNTKEMYGFSTSKGKATAVMSELTFDAHYHIISSCHSDLSAFVSVGTSAVTLKGNDGDFAYQYNAAGGIIRVGTKGKYYFKKRFGFMGMVSAYALNCSPKGIKGNNVATDYSTSIKGWALEFGPCYRFR